MSYLTLSGIIRKGRRNVAVKVVIRDEMTVSTFSDNKLAKELYDYEIKTGGEVGFNQEHNAIIHHYPKKSKDWIATKLKAEIKAHGGQLNE